MAVRGVAAGQGMGVQCGHAVQVFAAVRNVLVFQHALQAGAQHGMGLPGKLALDARAQGFDLGRRCARGQGPGRGGHGVGRRIQLHGLAHRPHARTPGAQAGIHTHAGALDGGLESGFAKRQFTTPGQCTKQRGRQHAVVLFGQRLHIVVQEALRVFMPRLQHGGGIGNAVAGHHLLLSGVVAVRRCDQRGALGRDQAALHGAPGFHEFGRNDDVHLARHRHQRQHGCAAVRRHMALREQLDVINGGAGTLRHADDGRGLRQIAIVFGQVNDPVHQHSAALATHGKDGDGDGACGVVAEYAHGLGGCVHDSACAYKARWRSARPCRAWNQPTTLRRQRSSRCSHALGLRTHSVR